MVVIEDNGFSNIIKHLQASVEARWYTSKCVAAASFPRVIFVFDASRAISRLPTEIFLLLSVARQPDPVGEQSGLTFLCSQCDIAPSFFAAPQYFVAGNCPTNYRGAVSVGALSPGRSGVGQKATQNSYRPYEGVSCNRVLCPRTNRPGQTNKGR